MPVRIRLTRRGSKRRPFYRIVVVDSRGKRDGGFLEQIGQYNPITTPHEFKVDEEKVFDWLKKGAQLSDGARDLLRKHGTLRKWDSVRRGLPIPPEPEKVIEVQVKEEKPVEEPVEEAKTPESVETPESVKAETAEAPEPEKVIEVQVKEEKPVEEPVEEAKTPESVETPEPVKAKTPEAPETPEPVKVETPETPEAAEPPETTAKPEDTSTP